MPRPRIYVRANRKQWALSQEELAGLLGVSQSVISRYEDGECLPELNVALALQVVFGKSPRALFNTFYAAIEDAVMRRAAELDRKLVHKLDAASMKKKRLLQGMAYRAKRDSRAA